MTGANMSVEQMRMLLDDSPMAVYVCATDDYELLYANEAARAMLWNRECGEVVRCYQAAGYDEPCPFCRIAELSREELLTREFRHPLNQRTYHMSGKLTEWSGRSARIEYMTDVTDKRREDDRLRALKEELENTLRNVPCGVCVYQWDGKEIQPLSHNPAFYRLMGYSDDHIHSVERATSFLGVHPDDLGALRSAVFASIENETALRHTYRIWNDSRLEYRWIELEGLVKRSEAGLRLLYAVYSDVTCQKKLERELTLINERMQVIINAIPGGVAIYKISDKLEAAYFSDGVSGLSGYTADEYRKLIARDSLELVYEEDREMVKAELHAALATQSGADFEFRKRRRDGDMVWCRAQVQQIGELDGAPALHCVFHNITALKKTQLELNHLINSIPGGIASYRVEGNRFIPTFISDGVIALSGYERAEYGALYRDDVFGAVYGADRERLREAALNAVRTGEVLDISYRIYHKSDGIVWTHMNGRRIGPASDAATFYVVLSGMSDEALLFQRVAAENADGIYIVARDSYELLYASESKSLFMDGENKFGEKCYARLHGRDKPCEFCTLHTHAPDGVEHDMAPRDSNRFFSTRFREIAWNGIPAYVKCVRDITDEVNTRREKERLEIYFQTIMKHLPGGISVVRCWPDKNMTIEYISEGYARMMRMSVDEAYRRHARDIFGCTHPDDVEKSRACMLQLIERGGGGGELTTRMLCGDGGYIWMRDSLSLLRAPDGTLRFYSVHTDITESLAEKERLRRKYEELILQHYCAPDPDTLLLGHCNVTRDRIIEIIDYTGAGLQARFGMARNAFFTGVAGMIPDARERDEFLNTYLNAPVLAAFERDQREFTMNCFIQPPDCERGKYVRVKVILVEAPQDGELTGILTVTDITRATITDRILRRLSIASHDFVADVNLADDTYTLLNGAPAGHRARTTDGRYSEWLKEILDAQVLRRDRWQVACLLEQRYMTARLSRENFYSFPYSVTDANGAILSKQMNVFATDLRLGRVCLASTDITESVREQQGLLNMMAYAFELMCYISIDANTVTIYTRQTVLENLPPYVAENYSRSIQRFAEGFVSEEGRSDAQLQFQIDYITRRLNESPAGYDFVLPYVGGGALRYKQINVLWGDRNHTTICMVRADVTDMLAAERHAKKALEDALALAEEANRAKSNFLSTMSHDMRTPMNAIMGMTTLAAANIGDPARVSDCLRKISISSRHLLSLINDVLDMSRIEHSQITLSPSRLFLSDILDQLFAIIAPQAHAAGLWFQSRTRNIHNEWFYGDALRINQIMINLLSNAVKFTPPGGRVEFIVDEIAPLLPRRVRYRFMVVDTGPGISDEFRARMFEPFSRSADTAHIEGAGLGLSITRALVDLIGGQIRVDSEPDSGSTFTVELEFDADHRAQPDPCPDSEPLQPDDKFSLANQRFLIAEDNAINAEIISELLRLNGATSELCANGEILVRQFAQTPPNTYSAILMDIQMPLMNGYQAARAIRLIPRPDALTIPIIAMTANAFTEDIQAAANAGMNAHIPKPIDMNLLKATIRRLGRGE